MYMTDFMSSINAIGDAGIKSPFNMAMKFSRFMNTDKRRMLCQRDGYQFV